MAKLSDIARQAGLADSTARRYVSTFPEWLPSRTEGRARIYDPEAVQILRQVAKLYAQGMTSEEVRQHLAREHSPTIDAVNAVDVVRPEMANIEQALLVIANQRHELERLRDDVQELRARLDKLDQAGQIGKGWLSRLFSR